LNIEQARQTIRTTFRDRILCALDDGLLSLLLGSLQSLVMLHRLFLPVPLEQKETKAKLDTTSNVLGGSI